MRGGICARADLVAASWVINTDGDISLNIALHIALHNPTFNFIDRTMVGKCSSIILRRGIYYFFRSGTSSMSISTKFIYSHTRYKAVKLCPCHLIVALYPGFESFWRHGDFFCWKSAYLVSWTWEKHPYNYVYIVLILCLNLCSRMYIWDKWAFFIARKC